MPRVLLVCEPPEGGAPEQAVHLALGLGEHGFEIEFAGPLEAGRHDRLEAADIPVHRLPLGGGYGRPDRDLASFGRLARLMRTRRYDLIHCHAAKAGVLGRPAARALRIPSIYTSHSFPFTGDFSEARRLISLSMERLMAPLTTAYLCVSESERRIALERRLADPSKLHVVHNGSPACDCEVAVDERLVRMRRDGPVAAAVVHLRSQKSVDVLLDAVPLVLEQVPEARVAVVGDGPLREELTAHAARAGLDRDPRFAFLSFQAPAARHLRAIDLYVLPSSWEAFPIGVLEAQACGVPQVATDVGGTSEAVVPETGLLVPKRDPVALAHAMCELLRDPARRAAMADASRARHAERFGLGRMVAETAALYRLVLAV